jgi:RNA polymerase sigma-70 factor (ECF subfamily)
VESDRQLVESALAGRRASFAALVERYERAVRAAALTVLRNQHDACDAAQEAFVIAYRKLPALRRRSAFGPWLLRIARREALRLVRGRRGSVPLEAADGVASADGNGRPNGEQERLLEAVDRLPRHERVVLMLRYFNGRSVAEIAATTGRPVGTVTKQLSRAHRRLRALLAKEQGR